MVSLAEKTINTFFWLINVHQFTNVCGTLLKTSSLLPPVLTIFLQETQNPWTSMGAMTWGILNEDAKTSSTYLPMLTYYFLLETVTCILIVLYQRQEKNWEFGSYDIYGSYQKVKDSTQLVDLSTFNFKFYVLWTILTWLFCGGSKHKTYILCHPSKGPD